MAVATSTALLIGAGIAAAGTGYSVYAGERGAADQRQARRRQQDAQAEALRQQMIERQRTVQQEMRADRPTPASTISMEEMLSTTDRTGGVDDRLRLARPARLGG